LAGRVCAARRPAPGVLPHLRTARGLHGHHPTRGRATSVRAVRSMRIPPSGQPVRGGASACGTPCPVAVGWVQRPTRRRRLALAVLA